MASRSASVPYVVAQSLCSTWCRGVYQHDAVASCCPLAWCRVAVSISKIWHHAVPLAPCVVVWSLSTTWCCAVSLHIVALFHCTVHDVTASLSPSMTWCLACMDAWSFCRTWRRAVCQHHMVSCSFSTRCIVMRFHSMMQDDMASHGLSAWRNVAWSVNTTPWWRVVPLHHRVMSRGPSARRGVTRSLPDAAYTPTAWH